MNKFNVQITAIVTAGAVACTALFSAAYVLASQKAGLFDYLIQGITK